MTDVSYVPGPFTAVVGDQCWVLVEASPDSAAVSRIWQQFGRGVAADALLAGLLADGAGGVPGFALLAAGGDGQHRLFCRGAVTATIVTAAADLQPGDAGDGAAPDRIDGAGLLTWREHGVTGAERVFLGESPAGTALRLPATSGVLLAGCVVIDFTSFAARTTTLASEPQALQERPKKTIVSFPDAFTFPDTLTVPPPDGRPHNDGEYDFFWGTTQMRTVEDAAIRAPEEDGGPLPPARFARDGAPMANGPRAVGLPGVPPLVMPIDPSPPSRLWRGPEDAVPLGTPVPLGEMPPGPPGGLIDVPQWLAGPGGSGSTVRRGDLPEPVKTAPPDRIGPVVPALICPNGHLNPPSGGACRRCGAPLPHDSVPVPRPVLGVLRLSGGDVITLDRDVVMGRNPRTDFAGTDGEDRPHVVKLPNTDSDVSRTHLRVTLDGWHVLVTDLSSTNGTLVTLPGRDPQQLRPGEAMPIQPGTVVTLAEGAGFRYEVTD